MLSDALFVGSGKDCVSITSSADGVKLAAVVSHGNIWRSTDSGATWRVRPEARGAATPRRKEAL